MGKILKKILFGLIIFFLIFVGYFFVGGTKPAEKITWGVNFSQKHTENLGLNWQETYLALLDDLGARNFKIATQWDLLEPQKGEYNFEDLDWQVQKAEEKGAKLLLVIGMKTPRWPECHIPEWARNLNKEKQQERILELLEMIVLRYRGLASIGAWQVENEPLFPFGECPWKDKNFLKKEIDLVKSLDPTKPVIISDSGELSFWIAAAKLGDIVSTTLFRRVWSKEFKIYITHHWFKPVFYWRRAQIVRKFFGKDVICGELQTEPWCPTLLYDCSLEEQKKTMDLARFQANIEFARKTGLKEFYLWGAEWAYWLKEKQNDPSIWNEARKLFR